MLLHAHSMKNFQKKRGYTLIELIIAVGLFALAMTLVSGAYLMMIGVTRHAQGTAIGIDNLSFALETMTRTIRTGTNYSGGGSSFSVMSADAQPVSYRVSPDPTTSNGVIMQSKNNQPWVALTDPSMVNVKSLTFVVSGTAPLSAGDKVQPNVTMKIEGTVQGDSDEPPQPFKVETSATMRKTDL